MKMRTSFVSNSSSSSFVLRKSKVSKRIVNKIFNHVEEGKQIGMPVEDDDMWVDIYSTKNYVFGYTNIDNFGMKEFFKRIGVPKNAYEFNE